MKTIRLVAGVHPLIHALRAQGVTQRELARMIGVRQQSVALWVSAARRDLNYLVPAKRVRAISACLKVRPEVLRPDLFRGLT